MMTITDLRKHIIERIKTINDPSFLEAVKTIIDSRHEGEVFYVNEEMEQMLQERRENLHKGGGVDNDDVFNETNRWLEEK